MPITNDLVIEYGNPAQFKAYAYNARTHTPEQVEEIANAMGHFGFTNPMLIDENDEIIAGHGRQEAAMLKHIERVPFIRLVGLSDEEKRALRIADNKIAANAGWDDTLLKFELAELQGLESLIGFSMDDLAKLYGADQLDEEDQTSGKAPPDPETAKRVLAERFGVPPFTVLNAREGWWQDRKRAWVALGLQSELGRLDLEEPKAETEPK
jgi:ParB-like chromosome segregation protein Spo0J